MKKIGNGRDHVKKKLKIDCVQARLQKCCSHWSILQSFMTQEESWSERDLLYGNPEKYNWILLKRSKSK